MKFSREKLEKWFAKFCINIKSLPSRLKSAFVIQDGEKRRVNFWLIFIISVPTILAASLMPYFFPDNDSSYINQTSERAIVQQFELGNHRSNPLVHNPNEMKAAHGAGRSRIIKYSAKQIIDRFQNMPAGTQFIGKLLNAIDTRDRNQVIKVLLPYGGTYQGNRGIENGTILYGSHQIQSNSDRVFIRFVRLISPDGKEFAIKAQALNSKDFSPGLFGDLHTNSGSRLLTSVGLSMLSAGTDVLVEKESLGNSMEVTPKSTLKNAGMAGISDAAKREAERTVNQLEEEEYVTVDSGTEMVISLTESFSTK